MSLPWLGAERFAVVPTFNTQFDKPRRPSGTISLCGASCMIPIPPAGQPVAAATSTRSLWGSDHGRATLSECILQRPKRDRGGVAIPARGAQLSVRFVRDSWATATPTELVFSDVGQNGVVAVSVSRCSIFSACSSLSLRAFGGWKCCTPGSAGPICTRPTAPARWVTSTAGVTRRALTLVPI